MKNVFLSVVLIGALIVAGLGGTLATWSDSETSYDNFIETGSLDLMVNYADDWPWGTGVPTKVAVTCMIPQKWYGGFPVDLWNAGQCEQPSSAYIHIKNVDCSNIPPKEGSGYPDPITGDLKPEPELVAEYDGWVNCTWVNGIGAEGDDCSMGTRIMMIITNNDLPPNDPASDILLLDTLGKWECKEIYLFELVPCEPRTIFFWFRLAQFSEDELGLPDLIVHPDDMTPVPEGEEYDAALQHWLKFNDWPSWSMMKDRVDFDMEFDLVLWDP
jgi:predicted ribosomally synthesized peptide with SipW-like signal peptide